MRARLNAGRRLRGFTYLGLLFAIAIAGVTLGLVGQVWSTYDRRAKELQLLFIGAQFADALANYYYDGAPPGAPQQMPASLQELLRDKRYPDTRRYLRKIYLDPLTGNADWGIVRDTGGEITGVYSKAAGVPVKQSGFDSGFGFGGAKTYADWIFRATVKDKPSAAAAAPGQAAITAGGAATSDAAAAANEVPPVPLDNTLNRGGRR